MLATSISSASTSLVAKTRKPAKSNMPRLPPRSRYMPAATVTGTMNRTREAQRLLRLPATASSLRDSSRRFPIAFFKASNPSPVR